MLRRYASTDPPVGGTAFRAEDERPWSRNQAFFLRNAICFSQVSFFFPERDGLLILFINCGVGGGGGLWQVSVCVQAGKVLPSLHSKAYWPSVP